MAQLFFQDGRQPAWYALQGSRIPSLLCVYSEYLEVHQTELDKLTAQLKDMKRNSRLVRVTLFHRVDVL